MIRRVSALQKDQKNLPFHFTFKNPLHELYCDVDGGT